MYNIFFRGVISKYESDIRRDTENTATEWMNG